MTEGGKADEKVTVRLKGLIVSAFLLYVFQFLIQVC